MLGTQTVVVGAGVVGLSVARALALSGREVLVLERADRVGAETSSRNSEVIHSGIYYPSGSLKSMLCIEGRQALYRYLADRDIPHRNTGKLVVATSASEIQVLRGYHELAARNRIEPIEWLSAAQVREIEPSVVCMRALRVPCSGIVDTHALMNSLWQDLVAAGGHVALRTEVVAGRRTGSRSFELDLDGESGALSCTELVNSTGLFAPALARRIAGCEYDAIPETFFARGHYFSLSGAPPFSRLVYPVPEPGGLGIHVTVDMAGRVRFGPDVEWVDGVDYRFDEARRERFIPAIRRYYPSLDESRLTPGYVGVRPKITPPGTTAADFRIDSRRVHGIPGLCHLFGIESPGLTACLAIGAHVVGQLQES